MPKRTEEKNRRGKGEERKGEAVKAITKTIEVSERQEKQSEQSAEKVSSLRHSPLLRCLRHPY